MEHKPEIQVDLQVAQQQIMVQQLQQTTSIDHPGATEYGNDGGDGGGGSPGYGGGGGGGAGGDFNNPPYCWWIRGVGLRVPPALEILTQQ